MEDAGAVVPLRPGFDIQVRGFNRAQVIEHIELLEDQLRLVTIDRNEAVQLNADLRRLCDDTRQDLAEAEARLKSIESSDTGLPAASQRVQNMLAIAEEEVQTLRDQARRQAEIIRGAAETEANELINSAQQTAEDLRGECRELVTDVENRRDQLRRERDKQLSELRTRERRMKQAIRDEYKGTIAAAQEEADELLERTRAQCDQWDADTERRRREGMAEIRSERSQLEQMLQAVLAAFGNAREVIESSANTLSALHAKSTGNGDATEQADEETTGEIASDGDGSGVDLPNQRDDVDFVTVPLDSGNGNGPEAGHDTVRPS